jgi:Uma2 family endonuclease
LQEKCTEYINNGVRLCWLINPYDKQVEIYRLGQPVEIVQFPVLVSGEDVLLGFELQF